jgi:hypothetical protein
MTYYGAKELADSFRTVRRNTIQVAEDIPSDQYRFIPADGARSVAQLLAHIALAPRLQLMCHDGGSRTSFEGLDLFAILVAAGEEDSRDRTKDQVMDLLRSEGEVLGRLSGGRLRRVPRPGIRDAPRHDPGDEEPL